MAFRDSLIRLSQHLGVRTNNLERRAEERRPIEGTLTALYRDTSGETRRATIESVDVSGHGMAFRSEVEFAVGESLLITDGDDIVEAVIRHERKARSGVVYGVEVTRAAELPARLMREIEESFVRLSEEMDLQEMGGDGA